MKLIQAICSLHPANLIGLWINCSALSYKSVDLVVALVLGGHQHEGAEDEHDREDVNVKSAFLHVVGDAVSSVGVIVVALVIWQTGWIWVDPLASMLIGIIILLGSWRVLRPTLHLLMEGVPEGMDLAEIDAAMSDTPPVREVHDLHVWSLCAGHVALSAHVVVDDGPLANTTALMAELKGGLRERFGIVHTTIQIECAACGQGRPVVTPTI